MIHYHGLPITPASSAIAAISGGHAFVSFRYQDQLSIAMSCCQSFAVDNGAFSAWKSGNPITDWSLYYDWLDSIRRHPAFDWAVIPDVIDGNEQANNDLIAEFQERFSSHVGVPVWHLHESLEQLERLASDWPRVAFGSSGEYANTKTPKWWDRMFQAMRVVCNEQGEPQCKIHGLRMLDPQIFDSFPLASADSTNIAKNIGIDSRWRQAYTPPSKDARAILLRQRIEATQSPAVFNQQEIFEQCLLV